MSEENFNQKEIDDLTDGKTEEEIEKEVNEYLAKRENQKDKTEENEISTAASDPFTACVGGYLGNEYAEVLKFGAVSAAFSNPSWANFKKAAKELVKKGFKGSVVGISYNLFKALQNCEGRGNIT